MCLVNSIDNLASQQLLDSFFKKLGIDHRIANDGLEALQFVKAIKFDLIMVIVSISFLILRWVNT